MKSPDQDPGSAPADRFWSNDLDTSKLPADLFESKRKDARRHETHLSSVWSTFYRSMFSPFRNRKNFPQKCFSDATHPCHDAVALGHTCNATEYLTKLVEDSFKSQTERKHSWRKQKTSVECVMPKEYLLVTTVCRLLWLLVIMFTDSNKLMLSFYASSTFLQQTCDRCKEIRTRVLSLGNTCHGFYLAWNVPRDRSTSIHRQEQLIHFTHVARQWIIFRQIINRRMIGHSWHFSSQQTILCHEPLLPLSDIYSSQLNRVGL